MTTSFAAGLYGVATLVAAVGWLITWRRAHVWHDKYDKAVMAAERITPTIGNGDGGQS